jgi:hypothetical protein
MGVSLGRYPESGGPVFRHPLAAHQLTLDPGLTEPRIPDHGSRTPHPGAGSQLPAPDPGSPVTFSSSPIASDGHVYLLSEDGDAFVLRDGDRYDEIARNALGEMSLATPAADADSLYVRTQTRLYRIRSAPAR